ncbi:bolA-like protein 2 [Pieris brassicae]|uniref:BolA-like protein 2 n=1 Tax=Pieris brassicae TaxID=7116 RepID=A0A9P0TIM2_PIEBR|nr:bolA-like protein 2 [Pieris brassicae]CAH4030617.1 unnamed protein product [Pieris brassicae]
MVYTEEYIKEKLTKELDAVHVEVIDDSDGCGAKFSVLVVSDKFQGKPLLARHKLVNSVLQEELKTIHAFSQKALTVEQWKK